MKIIVLRWLPWSGKSTWAKEQSIPSISKDDIRELLHNGVFSKENEKEVVTYRDKFIEEQLLRWDNVIVDDTNLNPVHIKRMQELAKIYHADIEIKDFPTSIEECIKRDKLRDKSVGEKVIRDMAKQWNYPPRQPQFEPIATFSDEKIDAIVFDIDGTLAKNTGRSPYDMTRVSEDEVYEDIARLIPLFYREWFDILFVSGRDESCRDATICWLYDNTPNEDYIELFMRKEWDSRSDAIIKYEIAQELNKKYNIRYVFDDRNRVVKAWREAGFRCLQVAPWDF